jgi:type I restriction enzyme S subunit
MTCYVKLGELVTIIGGGTPDRRNPHFWNGDINWVSVKDLTGDSITKSLETITNEGLENSSAKLIPKGNIILPTRMALGKVAINDIDVAINQDLKALIIKDKNILDLYFLFYFLKSKSKFIESKGKGATVKGITLNVILDLEVPLIPLRLQKKVTTILRNAQKLIDKRKAQIEALDQLTQSVFLEMFGDPATNPKKWPMGFIKDLALKTQYGTSKKASEDTGKYHILRMNNITYEGHWDLTDLKYVDLDEKEVEKYLVHKGELLFNRTNSKELVGKTAVYRFEKPMAFAGYLVKVIPNEKANAEFISAYLNSKYGKSILFSMAKNIVGMANINAEELKSIKIYIPPKQLQDQFAEIVQKIESQRELFKKGLVELEKNFNSLMQRAFKGELFND